jgi:hypothetical protein
VWCRPDVPAYARNLDNARDVIAAMNRKNFWLSAIQDPNGTAYAEFLGEDPGKMTRHKRYMCRADTLAEAICRAALKAVWGEV